MLDNFFSSQKPLLMLALLLAMQYARAQSPAVEAPTPSSRFSFLLENDMWGQPIQSDRNYTMGVSLAWLSEAKGPATNPWVRALEKVNGALNFAEPVKEGDSVGWLLAESAFTPRDIRTSSPITNDRPYASLLYGGPSYWSRQSDGRVMEAQLFVGILGLQIGRYVQTKIHERCCRDRLPQGWDNQIGNGGAPTFLYHVKSISTIGEDLTGRTNLNVSRGFEIGYMNRFMAGASFAYGAEPSDLKNAYLMTFGNPTAMLKSTSFPQKNGNGKGFAIWLDLEVSAIAHNQLLQGAWGGDNRVRIPFREIAPIVAKVNAGIEFTILLRSLGLFSNSGTRFYWTQSWRSRDLRHNDETNHFWGGLVITTPI